MSTIFGVEIDDWSCDVRAAGLQEEPTKRVEKESILRHNRFVGPDEDGGSPANRSERSEPLDTASAASEAINMPEWWNW